MNKSTVRIQTPVPISDRTIRVPFTIEYEDLDGGELGSTDGYTDVFAVNEDGSSGRSFVWVETRIVTVMALRTTHSQKLDPNERDNQFWFVRKEIEDIEPLSLPVTTTDLDRVAGVVHSYVINSRPAWS